MDLRCILALQFELNVYSELFYVTVAYVYAAYYHVRYVSHHVKANACLKHIFRVTELLLSSIFERHKNDFVVCENQGLKGSHKSTAEIVSIEIYRKRLTFDKFLTFVKHSFKFYKLTLLDLSPLGGFR